MLAVRACNAGSRGQSRFIKGIEGFSKNATTLQEKLDQLSTGSYNFSEVAEEYAAVLRSVEDLSQGKCVHKHIQENHLEEHLFLANCTINMYIKCSSLEDAQAVFDKMEEKNVVSWTALIAANASKGLHGEAFRLFWRMQLDAECAPNSHTFVSLLNACQSVSSGEWIHSLVSQSEHRDDLFVGNSLITMYTRCGSLEKATQVFDSMLEKDVVSWTAIIGANQHESQGLLMFRRMLLHGVVPNKITYITLLSACSSSFVSLPEGKWIHNLVLEAGFTSDTVVANALINLYGKCGSVDDAYETFMSMESRDLVSWNGTMNALIENGEHEQVLHLFKQMYLEGMRPNVVSYLSVITAFANSVNSSESLRDLQYRVRESGYSRDIVVSNALISMYSKYRYFKHALDYFRRISSAYDLISWNSMLGAYTDLQSALKLFRVMLLVGLQPNKVTLITLLNLCADCSELEFGRKLHGFISERGMESDVSLHSSLMNMYNKCDRLPEAEALFRRLRVKNLVSWNTMLGTYSQWDHSREALQLFHEMLHEGQTPDCLSFTTILSACSSPEEAGLIRDCISESGFNSTCLETALITMYGKCGDQEEAQRVFERMDHGDVISWTSVIAVFAELRSVSRVQNLFQRMQLEGLKPDKFTFAAVLDSCTESSSLPLGKLVHSRVAESGYQTDLACENALVNMYVNCGSLSEACVFFNLMAFKDIVSWNAMSAAYAQSGLNREALLLFRRMQGEGVEPDRITFATALNVCANLGVLSEGKRVYSLAAETGVESDASVATGVIKLLAKCGRLEEARGVFGGVTSRWSVSLVNSIVAALSQHGHCLEAIKTFRRMQQDGLKPDASTLVSVISACSHAGLVEAGCQCFTSMGEFYGIAVNVDHYACAVDLVGRAGRLKLAEELIQRMPFEENVLVWTSLLGTCKLQGDSERGKRCAERILKLDPNNSAAHVVLSNIYCSVGRWKSSKEKLML